MDGKLMRVFRQLQQDTDDQEVLMKLVVLVGPLDSSIEMLLGYSVLSSNAFPHISTR
jgi:hypothetical protein